MRPQDLASDAMLSGEHGYCLATFQVALRWLLQLRWDELHFETPPPSHSHAAHAPPAREGHMLLAVQQGQNGPLGGATTGSSDCI